MSGTASSLTPPLSVPRPPPGSCRSILNTSQMGPKPPRVSHLVQSKSQSLIHGPARSGPAASLPSLPTSLAPFHLRWPPSSCSVTSAPIGTRHGDGNRVLALMELSCQGSRESKYSEHTHLSATPGSLHLLFLLHGSGFWDSVLISPLQRPSLLLKKVLPVQLCPVELFLYTFFLCTIQYGNQQPYVASGPLECGECD